MNRPSTSADVRASQSADGAVLIDVRQGIIFSLNVTGSKVWSRLEGEQVRRRSRASSRTSIAFCGNKRLPIMTIEEMLHRVLAAVGDMVINPSSEIVHQLHCADSPPGFTNAASPEGSTADERTRSQSRTYTRHITGSLYPFVRDF